MKSSPIEITWSPAEAETAHVEFPEIGIVHFWVDVCKAVEVSVSDLLDAGGSELRSNLHSVTPEFPRLLKALSGEQSAGNVSKQWGCGVMATCAPPTPYRRLMAHGLKFPSPKYPTHASKIRLTPKRRAALRDQPGVLVDDFLV